MLGIQNKKFKLLIALILASASVYLSMEYLLPLVIPFIIAYIIAKFINPFAIWFNKKIHIKKSIIVIIILLLLVLIIGYIGGKLFNKLFEQMRDLINNWNQFDELISGKVKLICMNIENRMGLEDGCVLSIVNDNLTNIFEKGRDDIMPVIMDTSLPAIIAIIEVLVIIVIVFITIYFIAKDMEKINIAKKKFLFAKELALISSKLYDVGIAYLKAQVIIMFITSVVCFFGFKILGNPYAMLLGVIFGLLDALPLIGIGIGLIPWSIIYLISGNYVNAVILFITFIICYLIREFLEPRLIGKHSGIHPLISIISIYIGYKLFGIIGVILGPISYIIIVEIMKEVYGAIYQGED